jgi:hypothetical protein
MNQELQCPVAYCQKERKPGTVMCARCWRKLPDDIRDQFGRDIVELTEARSRIARTDETTTARAVLAEAAAVEQRKRCIEAARFARHGHRYVPRDLRGRTYREENEDVDR